MQDGKDKRAYAIVIIVVAVVMLVVAFMIDLGVGLLVLTAAVVGIVVIYQKKPELLDVFKFGKKKKQEAVGTEKRSVSASSLVGFLMNDDGICPAGYTSRIVLLYNNGVSSQNITVDKEVFTIGRSSSCDFTLLGNTDISRQHIIIRYNPEDRTSTVEDNNSTHGTKLNGEGLTPGVARVLHNGDIIQIEDKVLTVQQKHF